jgi:hypothetical protein
MDKFNVDMRVKESEVGRSSIDGSVGISWKEARFLEL